MIIFKRFDDYNKYISNIRANDKKIGFVPTMGALHNGHLALISESKHHTDITVCSIFVNPRQFNNSTDLLKYPVTIEKDIYLLETHQCDILLLPDEDEVYPLNYQSVSIDLGNLDHILEGSYRPGHFKGVCDVMGRLLEAVSPHFLYLGQKDYQQCMIIKKLIEQIRPSVLLQIVDTIREQSGLAMSSRNARLSETEKQKSAAIYESLLLIKNNLHKGNIEFLLSRSKTILQKAGFEIDYVVVAKYADLEIISNWDGNAKLIALIAASINGIRLIDNLPLS